ncbi:ComEC/Rec2 family competence protein [Acidothermaceae bacterium B102]|nr:ComEC/Rec2 family competence protein [Acidothermaceae bacterium B102]
MSPAEPSDDDPPVIDVRLAVPALTAWGVCFVSTSLAARWSAIACAAGVLLGLAALLVRRRAVLGLCVALVAAAASGGLHVAALAAGPLPALARAQQRVAVDVTVATDPSLHAGKAVGSQLRPDLVILRGTVTALTVPRRVAGLHSPVLLLVSGDTERWMALSPSQRLVVDGKLGPPQPGDDITAVLTARGPPQLVGLPSRVERVAGSIRSGLRHAVAGQSADVRGLLPGLVLGDVSRMDSSLTDDFRTAGLTHLVAVSGANVAILFAVVLALTRLVRVPPRAAIVGSAVVLLGFVVLVRPTPSVLRAAAMAGLLVVGALTGRLRQPMSALLGAVLLLVLVDPELSRSAGFALSTVATAALLVVAPRWAVVLRRHLPRRLADSLAVATAAQLACGPLIAVLSGQVSLVSIPANLLAEPAVPFATVMGVLAAVTAPLALPLAQVCARVAALPTIWLILVARHAAHAPYATIAWSQNAAGGVGLALLTVAIVLGVRRRWSRRILCAAAAGLLVSFAGMRLTAGPWAGEGWAFVACDVGQGDGLVLNAGPAAVVVDAGPDPGKMKSCLDHLGVRHVALVVLSHLHADHVEGLPGVLEGRRVDAIDVGPLAEPVGESHRVLGWATAAHVPVHHLVAGDSLTVGDLTAIVVGPEAVLHGTDSDPNNDSLVLRAVLPGVSILLTGDMEQVAQSALLGSGARLDADIVKVPHHGSANQDYALLAATGASVAVTSVGAGNTYGHPAPATMAAVSADDMRGFRTDRDGAVEVDLAGGSVTVSGHKGAGTPGQGRPPARPPSARGPAGRAAQLSTGLALGGFADDAAGISHGMLGPWQPRRTWRSDRSPSSSVMRSCWCPARSPPPRRPCARPTRTPTSATSSAPRSRRATCST